MKITLNTTPTCATCKVAERRLSAAGIDVTLVDLTENPEALASLKERLGLTEKQMVQVPLFEDENDEIFNISDLPDLLSRASAVD